MAAHEVQVEWWSAAEAALQAMHWRDASAVAAAVLHFAQTREGHAKRMKTDPWGVWLWVGSFKVRLRYDPVDRVLGVVYIWRG